MPINTITLQHYSVKLEMQSSHTQNTTNIDSYLLQKSDPCRDRPLHSQSILLIPQKNLVYPPFWPKSSVCLEGWALDDSESLIHDPPKNKWSAVSYIHIPNPSIQAQNIWMAYKYDSSLTGGGGKAGNKEVLRRVDLAGGSWKHALHEREGQGYLKLAIFTSLPPICELLATCVMKSTFNYKKRTNKNRYRFPELTHSVLHFSTTRLCLSCIHKQFIQIIMVKSY